MIKPVHINHIVTAVVMFAVITVMSACSSAPVKQETLIPAKRPVSEIVSEDVIYPIDAYDPWQGFNRRMYKFNAKFDRYVFLPVVNAYETVTPDLVEDGVTNFFLNLTEVTNLTNSALQLKGQSTFRTIGRILINTTAGIVGVFDIATPMGIHRQDEDFGQTLGSYGVGPGPYLVLPIFGPSSLRDTTGFVADNIVYSWMIDELIDELNMDDNDEDNVKTGLTLLRSVDKRHRVKFRYYATGSPFEYEWVRKLYLEKRKMDIIR